MELKNHFTIFALSFSISLSAVTLPAIKPVTKPTIPEIEKPYIPQIPITDEEKEKLTDNEELKEFLNNAKEALLKEEADEKELQKWIEDIENGLSLADIIDKMIKSEEFFPVFQNDSEYIKSIYKAVFQKEIDDETFQELYEKISSTKLSKEGLLYYLAKKRSFEDMLKADTAFSSIFFNSSKKEEIEKLTAFVKRMYTTALGRDAEPGGLNYWELMLSAGKKSPQEIAVFFFTSEEFQNQNLTDEEFLDRLYQTVLDRKADEEGYEYWLNKMEEGMSREDIIKSFIDSKEFQNILKEYGLK